MSSLKKKLSGIQLSTRAKVVLLVLCTISLYFVPHVIRGQYWGRIINQAIVNMLVVLGLNLLSGYLGLLNVGASGMVAVGAYTAALLATRLGVPMIVGIVCAIVVGVILGNVLGITCLRLNGIYLVLMTSAFAEIVRTLLINMEPLTGGAIGVKQIPAFNVFGHQLTDTISQYYLFLTILIICVLIVWRITHSKWGRVFLAIKDNYESVETCGINVASMKMKAFTAATILACVAGALYAGMAGYITPTDFTGDKGNQYVLMMMVGGWSNVFGSLLGAVLVTVLPDVLKFLGYSYWLVFYLIVFVIAIIMPGGLVSIFTKGKTFNFDSLAEAFHWMRRKRRK